jgi:hypothetical protein
LLDKGYGFQLQRNDVATLANDWTRNLRETFAALKPPEAKRGAFGQPDLRRRRIPEIHVFSKLIPNGGDSGGRIHGARLAFLKQYISNSIAILSTNKPSNWAI